MTTPALLLEELFRFRQASAADTAGHLKYNHDELCRIISDQIHTLLDSFEKYRHISYVVQGPRDQGVDVLLKGSNEDEPEKYIALQVKSYKEIADKDSDLAKQLKAGLYDARSVYGEALQRYYILLFGDASKHFKRITALTNEFARGEQVRVIGPRDLFTFLHLPPSTLSAIVDRQLSDDDYVRKQAYAEIFGYSEPQLYFILACLCWSFENSSLELSDAFFANDFRILHFVGTYGRKALEREISYFSDKDLVNYAEPASCQIRVENYPAIRALFFDIQVRYGEDSGSLFNHLFELLRL